MSSSEFDAIVKRDLDLGQPLDLSPLDEAEIDRRNLIPEVRKLRDALLLIKRGLDSRCIKSKPIITFNNDKTAKMETLSEVVSAALKL